MVGKRTRQVKTKAQRDRDNARRLVLFLPDGDYKNDIIATAKREGFEHCLPGQKELTGNATAYIMWLHKQHKKLTEAKAA